MRKLFYIIIFLGLGLAITAGNSDRDKKDTKTISGKITDHTGESIPGAAIQIPETGETYFADLNGNFNISIKNDKDVHLVINTSGFELVKVKSSDIIFKAELSLKPL